MTFEGDLYKEMKYVSDSIKVLKDKHRVTKRARKGAVLRHIILSSTGHYIYFKHKDSATLTDVGKAFNLLVKRAYLCGRLEERRGVVEFVTIGDVLPLDDADTSLVELVNGRPFCKKHGAMNKHTPGKEGVWRCNRAISLRTGKCHDDCRAGCVYKEGEAIDDGTK